MIHIKPPEEINDGSQNDESHDIIILFQIVMVYAFPNNVKNVNVF